MPDKVFWDAFFGYLRESERLAEKRGAAIAKLGTRLDVSTEDLQAAIDANAPESLQASPILFEQARKENLMANPVIQQLIDDVNAARGTMASATTLIQGFAGRLQAGIDQALANGATAAELAPLSTLRDDVNASAQALAAAVAANP